MGSNIAAHFSNYIVLTMSTYQGAAVTINNYDAAHVALCELRRSGECELLTRAKKIPGRVSIFLGEEEAPTTKTKHIQVRWSALARRGLRRFLQYQPE